MSIQTRPTKYPIHCIACQQPLDEVKIGSPLETPNEKNPLVCNNMKCLRFGLLTIVGLKPEPTNDAHSAATPITDTMKTPSLAPAV